jgi:hypothetical protein
MERASAIRYAPMKRLIDLTPSDLDRVPVWRYAGENDDVARVSATDRSELSLADPGTYIARTQFHVAGGTQYVGYCSPANDATLDHLQPVILTADGPVFFHFDEPPSRETLDVQWQRLGCDAEEIFPVHFRCTVPLDGTFVTGTIDAADLTGAA